MAALRPWLFHELVLDHRLWVVARKERPRRSRGLPGARALQDDYEKFKREVVAILKQHRLDALSKITHSDFLFAVRDWIESQSKTG